MPSATGTALSTSSNAYLKQGNTRRGRPKLLQSDPEQLLPDDRRPAVSADRASRDQVDERHLCIVVVQSRATSGLERVSNEAMLTATAVASQPASRRMSPLLPVSSASTAPW